MTPGTKINYNDGRISALVQIVSVHENYILGFVAGEIGSSIKRLDKKYLFYDYEKI